MVMHALLFIKQVRKVWFQICDSCESRMELFRTKKTPGFSLLNLSSSLINNCVWA